MRNVLILMMCSFELLAAQPQDEDRYTNCESCLITSKEIEKIVKESTAESRQDVVEKLMGGDVCRTAPFYKHDHLPTDKMKLSCKHLLDVHYEEFRTVLLGRESERLDIALCYEHSTACVGVKRHSFQDAKKPFKDGVIETLLKENEAILRIARPVRSASSMTAKDEL